MNLLKVLFKRKNCRIILVNSIMKQDITTNIITKCKSC